MKLILDLIKRHKSGESIGIYATCSAHPLVIEAALLQGKKDNTLVLIEATSNQVNQDGGYTGMKPADYIELVYKIADKVGISHEKILLGGDHLGPNCWQSLASDEAMEKSKVLIKNYIAAGFRKIHLDCSMSCAGDPVPLSDETVSQRAAILCQVAEEMWSEVGGEAPVYVVGTEVPVPGGAQEDLEEELALTTDCDAKKTLDIHEAAFEALGLSDAWERVIGLVVQPGVEFDHHKVIHYNSKKATALSQFIQSNPHIIYEAHSTDYQKDQAYMDLVNDHFAILKVGPALTYALREAVFALDTIEREWLGEEKASQVRSILMKIMNDKPIYWESYYHNKLDLEFSFSDRSRYYWPEKTVVAALEMLNSNLMESPAPLTLISQYLPVQYKAICNGEIGNTANEIILHKIMEVNSIYNKACGSQK
ncbi:D-tagatose-bisphosphate aldolase, class II, non-catalytic subunit [Psychromonas hadalis]|uniref:D-tagatose-bisphosphate aldolase, class II, non-catalytic subunit n=1 Tax=Psychromonas hadalis TaxID=211669 RepID=UPI0003B71473|nr:D-tagatose-bisphosphate aldolase, class II, non-catalytic subunit [Psychromonas hadalis]